MFKCSECKVTYKLKCHLANHVKRFHDKDIPDVTLVDINKELLNQENSFITEAANRECVNEFGADTASVWNPAEEQDLAETMTTAAQLPPSGKKSDILFYFKIDQPNKM